METCRTCTYYISGDPPACNALHIASDNPIECSDWSAIVISQGYRMGETRRYRNPLTGLYETHTWDGTTLRVEGLREPAAGGRIDLRQWHDLIPNDRKLAIFAAIERQFEHLSPAMQAEYRSGVFYPDFVLRCSETIEVPYSEYWRNNELLRQLSLLQNPWLATGQRSQRESDRIWEEVAIAQHEFRLQIEAEYQERASSRKSITASRLGAIVARLESEMGYPTSPNSRCRMTLESLASDAAMSNRPEDAHIELVAVETPIGLRWAFNSTVIFD